MPGAAGIGVTFLYKPTYHFNSMISSGVPCTLMKPMSHYKVGKMVKERSEDDDV